VAAGHELGVLKTDEVKSVTLEEAVSWFGSNFLTEPAFASKYV
jgi:hypothetical protein